MEVLNQAGRGASAVLAVILLTGARVNIVPKTESGGGAGQPAAGSTVAPARPAPPSGRTRIIRRDGGGASGRTEIIRHPDVLRQIRERQRHEIRPGRYYWHRYNGHRYAHYYDRGVHWYGYRYGPHFRWTRFHRGYWWWHDPSFNRWVYWSNGYWWWPGPSGLSVYIDNVYHPYAEAPVTVSPPPVASPPGDATRPPVKEGGGGEWASPDGKRMVQIIGENSEAFLYDASGKQPVFMGYLGSDVERVRFSDAKGKPARILLDFKDGTFAFFTLDGNKVDGGGR